MRLEHLFQAEVRFQEFFFPRGSSGSDPHVYCLGEGLINGDRLRGTMRWTNRARRRNDGKIVEVGKSRQNTGTWLPHFDGVIRTEEGVEVLFSFAGHNISTGIADAHHHRSITARMTFSSRDDRYLWLNDVYGVLVGRGAWPADGDNAQSLQTTGRYKEDEVWQLSGFACVNEIDSAKVRSPANLLGQPVTKAKVTVPQLKQLFVGNLVFEESIRFPMSDEDADWTGYATGGGTLVGEDLLANLRCTVSSRRRVNGGWLPHLIGRIRTNAGETVLVTFRGYSLPTAESSGREHHEITGSMTFQTQDEAFKRLNTALGLLEGNAQLGDGERWRIRTFECVNPTSR